MLKPSLQAPVIIIYLDVVLFGKKGLRVIPVQGKTVGFLEFSAILIVAGPLTVLTAPISHVAERFPVM